MFLTTWKLVGRPACFIRPLAFLRLASSYNRETYLTLKSDPEKWKTKLSRNSFYIHRRYTEDPDFRNKRISESLSRHKKSYQTNEKYRNRRIMTGWIVKYTWFREHLPWKSHHPVLYSQKVVHTCTRCGVTRRDGLKIWWESDEPENYICHGCYAKADWNEMMPEGYEKCRTKKDMVARMQQLGTWTEQEK